MSQSRLPTVLVAQSYYRLGKVARAAKLFQSVPLEDIPNEATFDYILAMFSARKFREVIKAFPHLPEQHPYKDTARFYTGVSLMQFRLYEKAKFTLRGSRRLPPSLVTERRRLLNELDDLIEREKSVAMGQGQQAPAAYSFYYRPIAAAPTIVAEEPILPGGVPGKPAAAPKSSGPVGAATSYVARVGFDFTQKATYRDSHGFKEERKEEKTPSILAALGLKYAASPRPFGAQPTVEANLSPVYSHTETDVSSGSLKATEADPENVQNVVTNVETATYKLVNTYGVSGLYPVSDPVDVSGGYTVVDAYPKANSKKVVTTSTAALKVAAELSLLKFDLGYDHIGITSKESSDFNRSNSVIKGSVYRNGENSTLSLNLSMVNNGKPQAEDDGVSSTMNIQFSWLRNFEDFSLGLIAKKVDKQGLPEKTKGVVGGELGATAEASYSMSFGVSLVGSASYSKLSRFAVSNRVEADGAEAKEQAFASGSLNRYAIGLKVAPASFFALSASYDYTTRDLTVEDEAIQKQMQREHWSLQTTTIFAVSASHSF
jgi:hypothetical protein